MVERDKHLIVGVRRCEQGRPPKLSLSDAKLNLLVWIFLCAGTTWESKDQGSKPFGNLPVRACQGGPPRLYWQVICFLFLQFPKVEKNWNSSIIMRKCNWWMASLFKQCISDLSQNDLVLIPVDDFLSVDWVLDILVNRKVKGLFCFCAGHTVASKYLASTFIQSIRLDSLGRPPKTRSVWYLCLK